MSKVFLTQNQRIKRLYRHSLKNCLSWCIDREIWYDEIERIRGLFEKNAGVKDRATIDRLISRGEQELRSKLHPDPYIVPYYIGGSMYARNPPYPKEMHQQLDYGREKFE